MDKRPLLVDLFCGAGGAAAGYYRAGFDIIGVDIEPQPNYPYAFVQADALDPPLDWQRVAAVHASPPCQHFTAYGRAVDGLEDRYEDLLEPTRNLLGALDRPYVIENVAGAPLLAPIQLCGSSFGLDVRRHRLFESNVAFLAPPCHHAVWNVRRWPPASNRSNRRFTCEIGVYRIPLKEQKAAMGIDWPLTLRELSESIPPAYTEFIGEQLLAELELNG